MAGKNAAPAADAVGAEANTPIPEAVTPIADAVTPVSLADLQSLIVNQFSSLRQDIDDVRAETRAEMAALASRVDRAESGSPQFRPSDPTLNPQSIDSAMKQVQPGGDPVSGVMRYMPIGTDSHKISDAVAEMFIQEFDAGDLVTLNREAQRDGHPLTWGEISDKVGIVDCPTVVRKRRCSGKFRVGEACTRCGFGPVVKKVYWFEPRTGQWCYEVRFHGMTGVNGMMFFGNELLARR